VFAGSRRSVGTEFYSPTGGVFRFTATPFVKTQGRATRRNGETCGRAQWLGRRPATTAKETGHNKEEASHSRSPRQFSAALDGNAIGCLTGPRATV
jgi:hypothetical protein